MMPVPGAAVFEKTLEEFAGFLCIKVMQRIEKFPDYDLETVLNSMFGYKFPKRAPDSEPPSVSWLIIGCKGRHYISHHQIFNHLFISIAGTKVSLARLKFRLKSLYFSQRKCPIQRTFQRFSLKKST